MYYVCKVESLKEIQDQILMQRNATPAEIDSLKEWEEALQEKVDEVQGRLDAATKSLDALGGYPRKELLAELQTARVKRQLTSATSHLRSRRTLLKSIRKEMVKQARAVRAGWVKEHEDQRELVGELGDMRGAVQMKAKERDRYVLQAIHYVHGSRLPVLHYLKFHGS